MYISTLKRINELISDRPGDTLCKSACGWYRHGLDRGNLITLYTRNSNHVKVNCSHFFNLQIVAVFPVHH